MKLTLTALVLACISVAQADIIRYSVNLSVGAGTVTGYIVTDATIGNLGTANIVDWNLLLTHGTSTFDLVGPQSLSDGHFASVTGGLSATPTELLYNFSGSPLPASGQFSIGSFSDGLLCFDSSTCGGFKSAGTVFVIGSFATDGDYQSTVQSGIGAIATDGVKTIIPEPGTWSLTALALAVVWRRRTRTS